MKVPMDEPPSKNMRGMAALHPDLPQIPFFVGIIGPRHSGKSVLLYNLLSNGSGMYGASFKKKNIVTYAPTKDKDPTLKQLNLPHMYGPPLPVPYLVDHVRSTQQAYMEADNMTGVLLVFDDATKLKNAWPAIEELSYTGRHDHIHTLYVAHKLSSVPRGVRTQTQQWIIFKPHEESEKQWVLESFATKKQYDLWHHVFQRAWAVPHNFVYIDYERKEFDDIYRSGFHDPLFTPEESALVQGGLTTEDSSSSSENEIDQEEESVNHLHQDHS